MGEAYWSNKKRVLGMIERDGRNLEKASEELRDDKEVVMAAVQNTGYALKFASERLQDDKNIVMAAVKQSGWALEYASERLQDDKEIVIAAIELCEEAFDCASERLQKDMDVVETIFKTYFSFEKIPDKLDDDDFMAWATGEIINALQTEGGGFINDIWEDLPQEIQEDESLQEEAVKHNSEVIDYMENCTDEEQYRYLCLLAIETHKYDPVFSWIPDYFQEDEEFVLEALKSNPRLFRDSQSRDCAEEVLSSEDFIINAIEISPEVYYFISEELQEELEIKKTYEKYYKKLSTEEKKKLKELRERLGF